MVVVGLYSEVVELQLSHVVDCFVDRGQHAGQSLVAVQRFEDDRDSVLRRVVADFDDRLLEVLAQVRDGVDWKRQLRNSRLRRAKIHERCANFGGKVNGILRVLHRPGSNGRIDTGKIPFLAGVVVPPGPEHFRHF